LAILKDVSARSKVALAMLVLGSFPIKKRKLDRIYMIDKTGSILTALDLIL